MKNTLESKLFLDHQSSVEIECNDGPVTAIQHRQGGLLREVQELTIRMH